MAQVYADLIRKGAINKKTGKPYKIEDVPAVIREYVKAILGEDGGDNAG